MSSLLVELQSDSIKENIVGDVPVHPPELVIEIVEVVVNPAGTTTTNSVSLMILKEVFIPPKSTDVTALKLFPVIVTNVFSGPDDGEKLVIIGAGQNIEVL
jgi:hypothetical protein